jgi:hypothetical protein
MRRGILSDLQGNPVGSITEGDDGAFTGEGVGEQLVEQAPLKTFDDWMTHLHHSTYLRIAEAPPDTAST